MSLHINIEDLLSSKTVESDRIEFKEGWNPDAIYRSICAFANDFDNTGGGYILIGVEEKESAAKRPVKGLSPVLIAEIQRKMIGMNNLINPVYHPKLFIENIDKKRSSFFGFLEALTGLMKCPNRSLQIKNAIIITSESMQIL